MKPHKDGDQQLALVSPPEEFDVSIVMPCLNEIECLAACIDNARDALALIAADHGLTGEIVIADNGSTDGSQALARSMGARVVDVAERGYGAALIHGFNAAHGRYLVMGDADGSYDFRESSAMIGRLVDGADLCMGSRFAGGIKPGAMPWKNRYIGNPALTGILNLFFRSGIEDAHCGLRAIRKDSFQALGLTGTGMEFASEMVIKAALKGVRMDEVPATLSPDLRQRPPHLRPWRDGWRHLRYLFMLSPTWAFGAPALLLVAAGLAILVCATLKLLGVPGPAVFGDSWAVVAGFMVTAGHLAWLMAVATHIHGVGQGYRRLHPLLARFGRLLTLETALMTGGALIGLSALGLAGIGYWWSALGFAALPTTVPLVIVVAVGTIGVQTALGGFMLAVIGGNSAQFVAGSAAR